MLGLLGLQIFEATGADIDELGEERGPEAPISDTETIHVPLGPTLGTGRQAQPGRASSSDPSRIAGNVRGSRRSFPASCVLIRSADQRPLVV